MSDLTQFKHIMKEVERELQKWQAEKATCVSYLRELESDMLKGRHHHWTHIVTMLTGVIVRRHAQGGD